MKLFFLLCALSAPTFAQALFPQVFNQGRSVQVQAMNNSVFNFNCSGPVYVTLENNDQETHYYYEYVRSYGFSTRYFYPRGNQNIRFVNHSIFCNRM